MIRTPPQLRCSSRTKPYLRASFQGSRTLIQKRKLFPNLPTASPGLVVSPRRALCGETNINFKLQVNGDIPRENAVKPNDVLICSAELKTAGDLLLSPLKTNSNSSGVGFTGQDKFKCIQE
ncbi:hypothetical protein HN011_006563 [Eciton burchellii]|nr:hypothetical protein HN011_006563 [Eciton burchellii]